MNGTIWTEERKAAARASVEKWRGTPHHDRLRIPGRAVDCVNFVAAVMIEACIIDDFTLPFYDPRWGYGRRNNVIADIVVECFNARELQSNEAPEFGDLAIFKVGRQSNHIGIVVDGQLWHCMTRRTVEPSPLNSGLLKQLQTMIRVTAPGFKKRPETLTIEDFKE